MSMSGGPVELRLRAAVESSPSGLLMIDADGRIVLVNREIERLFGYAREELLGKSVDMLVPARLRSSHPGARAGFFAAPRVRTMGAGRDLFGLRKDGSEVPVEIGLTPVATNEGLFVISSIVDISARKRAEQRFRVAVDSSPNGMVMVDATGKIVLVNREIERLFGYAREEVLGQPIEMLVPAASRGNHPSFREAFFNEPRARSMGIGRDLFGVRKDGTQVPVEIGLNPIETDEGLFVLSSVVDISARKQAEDERRALEEQLRQAQKMEAVGTLAGGIAHDFNNILGAIIGYGELLFSEVGHTPSVAADIAELLKSAQRGKDLVERILAFSRRQERVRRPLDLGQTVSEVHQLLRATIPAKIDVRVAISPATPRVAADATSVHQVIMNLATNAAHAMPNGGRLEIDVEPFYLGDSAARARPGLREGPHTLLVVRDTGMGMDRMTRERAFEPFFTTKAPGAGTGLGLAMVHGIMHDHLGAVELESEPGKGTTVRCLFPALAVEASEAPAVAADAPRGHGESILYVEDEDSLARVGQRRLVALGYEVVVATDPAQALQLVRSAAANRFALIITDYSMPHMSGLDLAEEITRIHPHLPILMLTGYMENLPEERVRSAGVKHLVKKPLTMVELALAVKQTMG
jgi:PAS domain S-box-containing protein